MSTEGLFSDYLVINEETMQPASEEVEVTRKCSVLRDQSYLSCNDPLHSMEV